MIKKPDRSKFLQKELDENNFSMSYNFIMRYKNIDSTVKLLLNDMCNDLFMNGAVTWKHQTYADHIGISRRQIIRWFDRLVEIGILIPENGNKQGSKSNRFKIDINPKLIKELSITGHVTPKVKTCDTQGIQHVTPKVKTCDTGGTYNKANKSNKDLLGEGTSLGCSSPVQGFPEDWLNQLNLH